MCNFPMHMTARMDEREHFLMVHGDCVSEGCYAMTDPMIEEIYVLVERALGAGQVDVPVHIFPFKMTPRTHGS